MPGHGLYCLQDKYHQHVIYWHCGVHQATLWFILGFKVTEYSMLDTPFYSGKGTLMILDYELKYLPRTELRYIYMSSGAASSSTS